ncbi:unnamed protein product [Camellia sinensis]
MYEGQRDMFYNQTFNLDQVEFASEGIKDAKQTVCSMELLDMSPQGAWFKGFQEELVLYTDWNLLHLEMDALEMSALKSANKKTCKMRCDGP